LHVSPFQLPEDITGGALRVNLEGINHYQKFGYKCRLGGKESFEKDCDDSNPSWMTVPYRYNRGTLFDGDFPHYATEVTAINNPNMKRVILGFNCFTKDLKECNSRAPEHSDAFNRTIKLYQKMAAMGLPVTSGGGGGAEDKYRNNNDSSSQDSLINNPNESQGDENLLKKKKKSGGINLEDIKKNPALAKMLIKAAKTMKEKDQKKES
jgi:hypothetical protein